MLENGEKDVFFAAGTLFSLFSCHVIRLDGIRISIIFQLFKDRILVAPYFIGNYFNWNARFVKILLLWLPIVIEIPIEILADPISKICKNTFKFFVKTSLFLAVFGDNDFYDFNLFESFVREAHLLSIIYADLHFFYTLFQSIQCSLTLC